MMIICICWKCADEHIKPVLTMAYYEPMRKDEIIRLTWKEIWPPLALIYWPLGYHPDITQDLVNDVQNCD